LNRITRPEAGDEVRPLGTALESESTRNEVKKENRKKGGGGANFGEGMKVSRVV
jgi:hypothetical protein